MKFSISRLWSVWTFLLFFSALTAFAQPTVQKIEIRHIGPPAASDELIKANIRVKPGDIYTRTGVDDDVRTLYATGLFYNIQVAEERSPQGVTVIYMVQGKPILTGIQFRGNKKYSNKKLQKKITSKIGEPFDERKLFTDARAIQEMYQKAGRQKTTVSYEPSIEESTGRATVTFVVDEAPKIKIERVEFHGAQAFTQKKLRKVIKTRKYWMFSWLTGSGVLKDEQFEEDKDKLALFYQNEGYIDFAIKDIQFEQVDASHVIIHFYVDEGRQYKVGSVQFKGNSLFTAEQIAKGDESSKGIRMGVGQVFTPTKLADDIQAVEDFYGGKGYIDVRVRAQKNPNVNTGTMDLVYEIIGEDRGKSFIEKIEIQGNTKTKDRVIRRELSVAPGEVFDMVRVKRSKGRLEQMAYFDKVETRDEPTDIANRRNLIVDVEEGSTGNVEFGAGFSSLDSLVAFVGFKEGNFDLFNPPYFRGGGQKFRVNVQIGTRRKDFVMGFTEPWFLGRKLIFDTEVYYRELNYFSDLYDLTQVGSRFSLTRALWSDFLLGTASYTIENIGINDVSPSAPLVIRQEPENTLVSKVGFSLAYDTRNSVQLPNRGQRTELLTEVAGGPFLGDADFYKFVLRTSWYFPGFWEGHVWEVRGQAGVGDPYGDSTQLPLFDRFFLGGVYSLRGYKYREVGPKVDGEPVGGETYWFGSVEYSVPIIERLRFAAFYDIGNVYPDAYSFSLAPGQKSYSDNWGVGLRLNIPRMGPLRLDYAIPLTHDESTSGSGRFQFSVGFTADY